MLDEAGTLAGLVDDERGRREVRPNLGARKRLLQLLGQPQHGAPVSFLAVVPRHVQAKHGRELAHSYCNAWRTLRRAARRAGKIAAMTPTMIAAIANTISETTGSENWMKLTR